MARSNLALKLPSQESLPATVAAPISPKKKIPPAIQASMLCESCGDVALVHYDIHFHCDTCGSTRAHR